MNELGGGETKREHRAAIGLYASLKATSPSAPFYAQEEGYTALRLAVALENAGRLDAAEAQYRQAIALHKKAGATFPNENVFPERLQVLKLRLAELLRRHEHQLQTKSM